MADTTFKAQFKVRWRDMDAFGHVNNSTYLTYFEQARVDWWNSMGLTLDNSKEGPILIKAECTYLKPIEFPATLEVVTHTGEIGRTSFVVHHEIFDASDTSVKYSEGSTKIVWFDFMAKKPKPLPKYLLEKFK